MNLRNSQIVYTNNYIDIVMKACKECYAGKTDIDFERKLKYIEGKVKLGHESVMEHSNIIMNFDIRNDEFEDYIEVLESSKYLNFKSHANIISSDKKNKKTILDTLVGGSIRGYKELIRTIPSGDNRILKLIINQLYKLPKEFFYDFIKDGIMSESRFEYIEDEPTSYPITVSDNIWQYEIPNMDDINILYNTLDGRFSYDDLLDMCTTTIHFTHMSRIITQQLTRHRNAISQRSQRYVTENDCVLINPMYFKQDKYKDLYIDIDGKTYTCKDKFLYGVGDTLYKELLEKGLHKEDARSFLYNATDSSLYVTFTFRKLIYFLYARTDEHAQAEIRNVADQLFSEFTEINERFIGNLWKYIQPKYIYSENQYIIDESIDEILEEIVEEIKE